MLPHCSKCQEKQYKSIKHSRDFIYVYWKYLLRIHEAQLFFILIRNVFIIILNIIKNLTLISLD